MNEPRHALDPAPDHTVMDLIVAKTKRDLVEGVQGRSISPREVAQIAFWSIFGILVLLSLLYIVYWLGYTYEMSKLHDIPGVKPYEVTP